jgi:hypothetical protein
MTVPRERRRRYCVFITSRNAAGARSHASCACTMPTVTRVLAQAGLPRTARAESADKST